MRIRLIAATLLATASTLAVAVRPVHHRSTQHTVRHSSSSAHASVSRSSRVAGIDSDRATQIQSALIKQGYLSGEPTGAWDTSTVAAMQKLQGDNGWQTKMTPDARALNKLGLGAQPTISTPAPQ